jgi:hypothetical protein
MAEAQEESLRIVMDQLTKRKENVDVRRGEWQQHLDGLRKHNPRLKKGVIRARVAVHFGKDVR